MGRQGSRRGGKVSGGETREQEGKAREQAGRQGRSRGGKMVEVEAREQEGRQVNRRGSKGVGE